GYCLMGQRVQFARLVVVLTPELRVGAVEQGTSLGQTLVVGRVEGIADCLADGRRRTGRRRVNLGPHLQARVVWCRGFRGGESGGGFFLVGVEGRAVLQNGQAARVDLGLGRAAGQCEVLDVAAVGVAQGDQVLAAAIDVGNLTLKDFDRRLVVSRAHVFAALGQGGLHGGNAGVLGLAVTGGERAQRAQQ